MKKLLYILFFVTGIANAQIVTIPDANFKAKLLSATTTNYVATNTSGLSAKIDTNNDGEIQVSEALVITDLNLNNSSISNLSGIEAFLNLTDLNIRNNAVNTIDFINTLTNLNRFDGGYNQIQAVNFTTNNGFTYFDVSNNLITTVSSLQSMVISESSMNNNLITHLDLSKIFLSGELHTYFNNPLVSVNFKNNYIEDGNAIGGMINPTLQFVCVDDAQVAATNQYFINLNLTNVVINSYCTFTPGGNYNTITGSVTYDLNSDGCDVNDQPKQNIRMNINDSSSQNQGATFTNSEGIYNFYTNTDSFTITPNIENPTWFAFSPTTATIPFADNNNNVTTQNFCLSAVGIHTDLEVVIAPITPARPGFTATYQVLIKNKGNFMSSGQFTLTFNDQLLDFLDAGIFPNAQIEDSLIWNFTDLQPFGTLQTSLSFSVNSPTDVPPVNIEDELSFNATVNPTEIDEIPVDNIFTFNQTVVGSYDPNDITCIEGDVVPTSEIGDYLHYVINFENTGNSEAENIVVRTEIDAAKFDVNSLQMLNTSHNAYIRQRANIVEFIFQNIALESGGHGNVLLKIKTKSNLQNGDSVTKQANIYFDYNAPIETNVANTTFETLSSGNFEMDASISVHPNPTSSIVNINCNNNIKSIQLYDVQGRLLQTQIVNNGTTSIDISDKSNGIYFAKIISEVGVKVEKIIKE